MLLENSFLISKLAKRTVNGNPMSEPNDRFLIFLYKSTLTEICIFLLAKKTKKESLMLLMLNDKLKVQPVPLHAVN